MSKYPSDWDSRRRRVYTRDDYTCQNCGSGGGYQGDTELHAHHIVPISKGGSDDLTNLKTLCKGCHDAIHTSSMAPTDDPDPVKAAREEFYKDKSASGKSYGGHNNPSNYTPPLTKKLDRKDNPPTVTEKLDGFGLILVTVWGIWVFFQAIQFDSVWSGYIYVLTRVFGAMLLWLIFVRLVLLLWNYPEEEP